MFGNTATPANILAVTGGTTLTIGGGITVRGYSGTLGYVSGISGVANNSTISVVNEGTIQADSGTSITVNAGGLDNENLGLIAATSGSTVNVVGSVPSDGQGALHTESGGKITVTGSIVGDTSASDDFVNFGEVQINGGSASQPRLLEAMSEDRGPFGLTPGENFNYDTIRLGSSTYVRLSDVARNSSPSPEVVYVRQLIIPTGSTLDLNGVTLYTSSTSFGGGRVVNGTVIHTNVNNPPTITLAGLVSELPENAAIPSDLPVASIVVNDPDHLGTNLVTLSGSDAQYFTLSNGQLMLKAGTVLNAEAKPSYSVAVSVNDPAVGQTPDDSEVYTLNVLDVNEPPTIVSQSFSIAENSSNDTIVGTVQASDVDAGQQLTYAIIAGNGDTGDAFAIDPQTGELRVNNSSLLDFESNSVIALTVLVTDNGSSPLSNSAAITVSLLNVNEPPTGLSLSNSFVAENLPGGTVVGRFSNADPELGDSHTYSLVTGVGSINNGDFRIVGDQLVTAATFNYEAQSSYLIRVRTTDQGGLSFDKEFTITVADVNEAPAILPQSFTVEEDSPAGTAVGIVQASDVDLSQHLTYLITGGNAGDAFAIDPHTGLLSVSNPSVLDYETNPLSTLTVTVSDDGVPSHSNSATITVALLDVNEPPTILPQSFSIPENSSQGTLVGTVAASDSDAGQILTYAIIGGNGETGDAFAIDLHSGLLTVNNPAALNNDLSPAFGLTVQVTDNGSPPRSNSATITVDLTSVLQLTNFEVQHGEVERSFIQNLDLTFSSPAGLTDLLQSGRVQLTRYDLAGQNGVAVNPGSLSVQGNHLELDFGAQGIGGNRNSNVGDGYYRLALDLDGNGSLETQVTFYRLFGDMDGNGTVDSADVSAIQTGIGSGYNPELDANGDGVVDSRDVLYATRAKGHHIYGTFSLDA